MDSFVGLTIAFIVSPCCVCMKPCVPAPSGVTLLLLLLLMLLTASWC